MCGIRELMKATSKASQDKAAARKTKRASKQAKPPALPNSSKTDSAGDNDASLITTDGKDAGRMNGLSQQHKPAEQAASIESSSHADGSSVSSADESSADRLKQRATHSKGNKRDMGESNSGNTTKRLKSTDETSENSVNTAEDTTEAACMKHGQTQQADVTVTSDGVNGSTSSNLHDGTDSAGTTAPSQQVMQHQDSADSSSQSRSQTVDWLLNKFSDVAAAADKQVCPQLQSLCFNTW